MLTRLVTIAVVAALVVAGLLVTIVAGLSADVKAMDVVRPGGGISDDS